MNLHRLLVCSGLLRMEPANARAAFPGTPGIIKACRHYTEVLRLEKYEPIQKPVTMPANVNIAPAVSPAMHYPMPCHHMPVNIHASYEAINVYPTKKHHYHCGYGGAGIVLVLFILLVIVLRSGFKI